MEQTLKILVMTPKQLASELASEEEPGPAKNTLDAGMLLCLYLVKGRQHLVTTFFV